MATTKENPCLSYGISHSKQYKPSIVSKFINERDEDGNLIKCHSDAWLLLRQRKLQETIGAESIRRYIDNLRVQQTTSSASDLTDDELFALIPPKEVNNLTTSYEYSKYLQQNSDEFKKNYEKLTNMKKRNEQYTQWLDSLAKSHEQFASASVDPAR